MNDEYVLSVANTIKAQLFSFAKWTIRGSWGAKNYRAAIYKDMPSLKFDVNGRLFKGIVIISYHPMDYYHIYLQDSKETKLLHDEIYFDELVDTIDRAIETGDNMEEYQSFLNDERNNLLKYFG